MGPETFFCTSKGYDEVLNSKHGQRRTKVFEDHMADLFDKNWLGTSESNDGQGQGYMHCRLRRYSVAIEGSA